MTMMKPLFVSSIRLLHLRPSFRATSSHSSVKQHNHIKHQHHEYKSFPRNKKRESTSLQGLPNLHSVQQFRTEMKKSPLSPSAPLAEKEESKKIMETMMVTCNILPTIHWYQDGDFI